MAGHLVVTLGRETVQMIIRFPKTELFGLVELYLGDSLLMQTTWWVTLGKRFSKVIVQVS